MKKNNQKSSSTSTITHRLAEIRGGYSGGFEIVGPNSIVSPDSIISPNQLVSPDSLILFRLR